MGLKLPFFGNEKYFKYFTPWLAGLISIGTSIFYLFSSITSMISEQNSIVFYLLFLISLESIVFIFVTILLFIGIYKKNKYLFIPWMVISCINVVLLLILAFVEISIPGRNNGSPCIVSLTNLLITFLMSALITYCFLVIYNQFYRLNKTKSYPNNAKVTPSNLSNSEKMQSKVGEKGVKFNTEM